MSKEKTIEIPEPKIERILVNIRGTAPLLCDRYGSATMAKLEEREANPSKAKLKVARDPESEYLGSFYVISEKNGKPTVYGFPAAGVKKSVVSAAQRFAGGTGTVLYGAINIPLDLIPLDSPGPTMRRDPRAIGGKRSSIIYRSEFTEWAMEIPVIFDAEILDDKQVFNLFAHAGLKVGIGNWRPEKKGTFGTWTVLGGKNQIADASRRRAS